MRLSSVALSRSVRRPARFGEVAHAAREDRKRSWSAKTADIIAESLKKEPNELPANLWHAVASFASLPPRREDVARLLPMLERHANDDAAMCELGLLAIQNGLGSSLSPEFTRRLLFACKPDWFKAIEMWKTLGSGDAVTGAELYLRARQPEKAESVIKEAELSQIPSFLIRRFIMAYAEAGDASSVQRWVNSWQAPTPLDVNWLHHQSRTTPLLHKLELPAPQDPSTVFPSRRRVGEHIQHLVSALNRIIVDTPMMLDSREVESMWREVMSEPTQEGLDRFAVLLATHQTGKQEVWTSVIRLVNFGAALGILRAYPTVSAAAYAAAMSRADKEGLAALLELISPERLYTLECLKALAQKEPAAFSAVVMPQNMLGIVFSEHQITSLWRASPPEELIDQWLLQLTIERLDSARLLRAAATSLVRAGRLEDVRRLLFEFVVRRGFMIDPRIVGDLVGEAQGKPMKPGKLSKPPRHHLDEAEATAVIERVMRDLSVNERPKNSV